MDTNMSQALKIAGGLVIALVIIAALMYFFKALSPLQTQIDEIKAFEQTADFNKEFEVYNKNIMYGLDVISVINKAASYNKMYIDTYGDIANFNDLKDNYLVDIKLSGNIKLKQTIDLYKLKYDYFDGEIKKVHEVLISDDELNDSIKKEISKKLFGEEVSELIRDYADKTLNEKSLIDQNEEKYIDADIYEIIVEPSKDGNMKKTVKNVETEADKWSKATLETYVYNFKSKKFKCTNITYSNITGRITSLTFEEINL